MKILKFVIENYKAIRGRKEFLPNGASFFLIGGNGVGKTSAGHSIIDMLTKKFPSKPVTEGEHTGFIQVELDNGAKLLCKFTDGDKPKLEFITPDGYNVGAPKEIFQNLAGDGMSFDIDDMLKLAPKPLREKLEKIAGLDLSDISAKEKSAYDNRTLAKAQLRDQQGRVQPYDISLVTKQTEDIADVIGMVNQCNVVVNDWDIMIQNETNDKLVIAGADATVKLLKDELAEMIATQNAKIEKAQAEKQQLIEKARHVSGWLVDHHDETDAAKAKVIELNEKLTTLEASNKKIEEAKRFHQEFQLAEELEKKVASLNESINAFRQQKEDEIKAHPLPASGVTFNENGDILIDGLPFEDNQISASRKLKAGLEIATSMLGDIKYLHLDGAALDHESADALLLFAEEHGLQLCIERPEWDGGELKMEIADLTAPQP